MTDLSNVFEVMKSYEIFYNYSSSYKIQTSNNYSIEMDSNLSAQSVDSRVSVSLIDQEFLNTFGIYSFKFNELDVLKNSKVLFPSRVSIDSSVELSNFLFVNQQYFTEDPNQIIDKIGTGPKAWNNISQSELCSSEQGSRLKNQLSFFLQKSNEFNLGSLSGYFSRFLNVIQIQINNRMISHL
jgi:hypothetical protein